MEFIADNIREILIVIIGAISGSVASYFKFLSETKEIQLKQKTELNKYISESNAQQEKKTMDYIELQQTYLLEIQNRVEKENERDLVRLKESNSVLNRLMIKRINQIDKLKTIIRNKETEIYELKLNLSIIISIINTSNGDKDILLKQPIVQKILETDYYESIDEQEYLSLEDFSVDDLEDSC